MNAPCLIRLLLTGLSVCCSLFTLYAQIPQVTLGEIQGRDNASPLLGLQVETAGNVVTARGFDRFFIQSTAGTTDGDPLTSDGLVVFTGSLPGLAVGDIVTVKGRVEERESTTALGGAFLEVVVTASNELLPSPVPLDAEFPGPMPQSPHALERVEGMRVSFSGTFCGPTNPLGLTPLTANTSRPFREPGIRWPGLPGLPVWDGNPEVFWLDPNALGQPNKVDIVAGQAVSAIAVLTEESVGYVALPSNYFIEGETDPVSIPGKEQGEWTVGSLNCLQFLPTAPDRITKAKKLAAFIARQMGLPDVVALQEVGTEAELDELIFYLKFEDPTVQYSPYLVPGNDQINLAFLVKNTLFDLIVTQLGKNETFNGGSTTHDRPPLLLEGLLTDRPDVELKVLNLHMRSLNGIEGQDSNFVRLKRDAQARSVATIVQALQGSNLIVLGDFNAFPFTDGYVDVTNQIAGTPSLGAQFPVEDIVQPPLLNPSATLPDPDQRYSFVFEGNAQILDNCLTTDLPDLEVSRFAFARGNADYPDFFASDPNSPLRATDHDGLVLYLRPRDVSAVPGAGPADRFALRLPNPIRPGQWVGWQSSTPLQVRIYNTLGQLLWQRADRRQGFTWPELQAEGLFILSMTDANGRLVSNRKVWVAH